MKATKFLLFILFPVIFSCNSAADKTKDASQAGTDQPKPSGDANFSAVIDGTKVTGTGIDDMQLQNTAFIYPDDKRGKKIIFYLYSTKDKDDTKYNYSFRFDIPNEAGTYAHLQGHDQMFNIMLNTDIQTNNMARYFGDSATIHITTLTAARIAGTFSGLFKVGADTPHADKKEVTVTDGVFDIPFSTGNIKPE